MSVGQALVTAEEFLEIAAQSDVQVDLVRGEVVEVSRGTAIHGACCMTVGALLWTWARSGKHGRVASNDSGVLTERDPDTVRGPDVYYIRMDRLPDGKLPQGWLEIPPDLCVEVLSPNDRWPEVVEKINEFFQLGVPEVWVLNPETHEVQIHRDKEGLPDVLRDGDTLTSDRLPGFACAVADLFEGC